MVLLFDQYYLGLDTLINFILKIEQLLVQHLHNTKQVKLQGIGIFNIKSDSELSDEGNKDATAFSFEFNLKTPEDELLVNYIVQETRKIKPLASSDLESYTILAQQFLNLGKPFYIDGIGTIQKNQLGHYEFIPGHYMSPKIGDLNKQSKEKKDDLISSAETENISSSRGRNLMIGLSIVGIILVCFTLYYFITTKNNNNPEQYAINSGIKIGSDTVKNNKLFDTNGNSIKGNIVSDNLSKTDNNGFKIVLKEYPTLKAVEKAHAKLTEYGHKVQIITLDSSTYKLVMSFARPLKDTIRVKDSLKIFFGGKPYVELK